jgi:hypothetical protein
MKFEDLEKRVGRLETAVSEFARELLLAFEYIQPDAAGSLTKSRIALEKLVLQLYVAKMGRDPKKPQLGDMLSDNQFTRNIEDRILSRMKTIKDFGNLGSHPRGPVNESDAYRALDDLCEVLEWYLERYPEVCRHEANRGGGQGPERDFDGEVLRLLELLDVGSRMARSAGRDDRARVSFYALKDDAMAFLNRVLGKTGVLSYNIAPYLKRCVKCRKTADKLHAADPSRSWAYHLNLLPQCPSDEEDLDHSTVSMTVPWQTRKFNLHAPIKEALKWNLNIDVLERRVWIPEEDIKHADVDSSESLEKVVEELTAVLSRLRDARADGKRH